MEMVRQDADGVRLERQARLNCAIDLPQALDMLDKQFAGPVDKREREKEYPAFDCWTPASRHHRIMARLQGRQNSGRGLLRRAWPNALNARYDSAYMALIERPTACAKSPWSAVPSRSASQGDFAQCAPQGRVAGGGRLHLDSSRFGRVADRQLIRVIGGLKPCDKGRLGRLSELTGRNVSEA